MKSFSKNGKKKRVKNGEKPGRRLEETVARFEQILAGTDVKVTSPDRLWDHEAEEMREIDVTMRRSMGSVAMLIIVECRDHSRAQNVLWIEQLASKVKALRANGAMAVSSSGFSCAAMKKAAVHNIELRTLKSITKDNLLRLFPFSKIAMSRGEIAVRKWAFTGIPKDSTPEIATHQVDDTSKVIYFDGLPKLISLTDLYMRYAKEVEKRIMEQGHLRDALHETMDRPDEAHNQVGQYSFEIAEPGLGLVLAGTRYPMRAVRIFVEASAQILHLAAREAEAYSSSAETTHVARVGLRATAPNFSSDEIELLIVPGEKRYSITAPDSDGKPTTLAAGTYSAPPVIPADPPETK